MGARIDQRDADDAEGSGEVLRFHAEGCLEHVPGAGVEDLEEAPVEPEAGRIALAPFDGQSPAVGERHAVCLRSHDFIALYRPAVVLSCPPPRTARPRESGDPGPHDGHLAQPWSPRAAR